MYKRKDTRFMGVLICDSSDYDYREVINKMPELFYRYKCLRKDSIEEHYVWSGHTKEPTTVLDVARKLGVPVDLVDICDCHLDDLGTFSGV